MSARAFAGERTQAAMGPLASLTLARRIVNREPIDGATADRHYAEHVGKGFYPELKAFITRGASMVMVWEGEGDTWKVVRTLMGVTNPKDAAPGTIRGDLGLHFNENLVHGSDGPESAAREIEIFFPAL